MKCKDATNNELWGQIIDEVDFFLRFKYSGKATKIWKNILLSFGVTKQMSKKSGIFFSNCVASHNIHKNFISLWFGEMFLKV